jgi:hypothetical protein
MLHLGRAFALATLLCAGCGHAMPATGARAGGPGEELLERGDVLGEVAPPAASILIAQDHIEVWGIMEVADGSSVQAAYAGVDAITRAELIKAVEVRVASLALDRDSIDPAVREITETTLETVRGRLVAGVPLEHGWQRIRRGGSTLLRVIARLSVPRAELRSTLEPLRHHLVDVELEILVDGLVAPVDRERHTP